MAGFVQNLDDGELCLPSELIMDVGLSRYRHCSGAFSGARVLHESEVECLANKLPPFGTFDGLHLRRAVKQPLAVPPPFEGFKRVAPVGWFGASEREIWAGPCLQETQSGLRVLSSPGAYRGRVAAGFLAEMFRDHPTDPVQLQVEVYGRASSRPLLPVQSRSSVRPVAQGKRKCGGTGVFLPRVKELEKECTGVHQRQRSTRSPTTGKQMNPFQSPAEAGLPHEWTY
ncbi:uncharacterized protein LOC141816960 [Curcuma longa]|uniref:uncharacterized protein LOC141816960 n=1 Tax=Curcuma longa TaxID=136217 RepID=UPI003D9F34EE